MENVSPLPLMTTFGGEDQVAGNLNFEGMEIQQAPSPMMTPFFRGNITSRSREPASIPMPPGKGIDTAQLRKIVQDCIQKHMYPSANFFADKLVTIQNGDPDDVYLLARCYFLSKQFRRAVHLLKTHELLNVETPGETRYQYMAALCLFECSEFDECLSILGEEEPSPSLASSRNLFASNDEDTDLGGSCIKLSSAICLLRGQVYEALENRQRAILWYKTALRKDVNCYEALERLVEKQMLKHSEEQALLAELDFPPHLQWLRLVYESKLRQHDHSANGGNDWEGRMEDLHSEYGLGGSLDLMAGLAEHHYYRHDFRKCYQLSKSIIDQDPYHHSVLPVYLCSLVELEMKSELFYCAHQLVEAYPKKAVAWFSVACYYYLIAKHDLARRYFNKATNLDHHFAPGWIGFGNAFAAQEESDQAMAAYRTAARLFEGSHMPLLCIGMEYLRTNNLNLAHQFLKQTFDTCPTDPLIHNELGVIAYKREDFGGAVTHFQQALSLSSKEALDSWEPTLFNLGHAFRKLRRYSDAVRYYELALSVTPKAASINSALGFTYHLQGDLDTAVQYYHKALGIEPHDTFTSDMLTKALQEVFA